MLSVEIVVSDLETSPVPLSRSQMLERILKSYREKVHANLLRSS